MFTLGEALGGFVIGSVLGIVAALATARWGLLRAGLLPFAVAVSAAPIIALAPITNQWFGITNPLSKMTVVAVIVFFPVMINMARGLVEIDPNEIELVRSVAGSERDLLRKVRFPNSLPYLFSALKVGASLSVIAAIVTEYFGGSRRALGRVHLTTGSAVPLRRRLGGHHRRVAARARLLRSDSPGGAAGHALACLSAAGNLIERRPDRRKGAPAGSVPGSQSTNR